MKRVAIFAHYDKDNIVDDYVIYYLKALKNVCDEIIFVSCNKVSNKNVLKDIVTAVIDEQHNEYDFGSYKRGYLYIKNKLSEIDEIVFANDSCFGPFFPMNSLFEKMDNNDCDFWGITKNIYGWRYKNKKNNKIRPHIQTYFIVIKKKIFSSELFDNFMNSIQHEEDKVSIITKYEIGLTETLVNAGYKYSTYINAYEKIDNSPILKWYQLILKYGMPFMKCSLIKLKNNKVATVAGYEDVINKVSDYPIELIKNYALRYGVELKHYSSLTIFIKRFAFCTAAFLPHIFRKVLVFIAGSVLKYLKD